MDLDLYLKQLEELVNIDSGSRNAAGITNVAQKLSGWYRDLGWNVETISLGEETGPVLLITNRPSDHYDAMFIGHMDTVFPDGTAAKRPFRIEGENYYGPGVGDMKNGDTAMYHIAANLPREVLDKLSIAMVYNPDEEIGSVYSRETTDAIGRKADHIFVMESAGQKGTRHCFARKGSLSYELEFHGQAAHAGGSPELGKNVMLAVGTAILNLYAIPRHSAGASRVNVGTVVAGSGRNVIADEAKMEIEVRGETTEINQFMEEYAVNVIENAAKMHGCTSEMKLMGSAYSLTSDEALMERVKKVCEEHLHMPVSSQLTTKSGGSEDVSYMMRRVQEQGGQATFMRVLTKEAGPGHSRIFDIDEKVLPNAVKIFCGTVYDIMK